MSFGKELCPLMENWDKSKDTLFRPFLVGTFETMCSLVIWKKEPFFFSIPYRCWKESWSYWDSVLLGFEIRYSPLGTTIRDLESWSYWDSVFLGFEIRYSPFWTTIRDLDICLNMFKCLIYIYIYIYISSPVICCSLHVSFWFCSYG